MANLVERVGLGYCVEWQFIRSGFVGIWLAQSS
jgi:hypothetical protein